MTRREKIYVFLHKWFAWGRFVSYIGSVGVALRYEIDMERGSHPHTYAQFEERDSRSTEGLKCVCPPLCWRTAM